MQTPQQSAKDNSQPEGQEVYKIVQVVPVEWQPETYVRCSSEGMGEIGPLGGCYYTYPLHKMIRQQHMFVFQTYEQACEFIAWDAYHSYPLEIWRCLAYEVVPLKKRLAGVFIADFGDAYWEEQWYLCPDEQEYPRKYLPSGKSCYLSQPYEGECVCQQLQLTEKMPLFRPLRMSSSQTIFQIRVRNSWDLMKQSPTEG